MAYQQAPPPPPPQYPVYQPGYQVPRVDRHEGLAVTALVLGILGAVFGMIPIMFWLAFILGTLAIIFGAIGHRPTKGKWGLALGIAALVLGIVGVVIVNRAVNQLDSDLSVSLGGSVSISQTVV